MTTASSVFGDLMPDGVTPIRGLRAYNGQAVALPDDYPLHTWDDALTSGYYNVNITVAQGNLPPAGYHIEVFRPGQDISTNQYRVLRATSFNGETWTSNCQAGLWSAWVKTPRNLPLTWYTPTLLNGWTGTAYYAQDEAGNVFIEIYDLAGGPDGYNTTLFVLPAGMSPSSETFFCLLTSGGVGMGSVTESGSIKFWGAIAHTGNANTFLKGSLVFKGV